MKIKIIMFWWYVHIIYVEKQGGVNQREGMLLLCKAIIFCDSLKAFNPYAWANPSSLNSCPGPPHPTPIVHAGQWDLISFMGRDIR